MPEARFDFPAFYRALDAVRRSRRVAWKRVATEAGVSASSVTRMAQGSRPDIDTVVALAAWAGLDIGQFSPLGGQSPRDSLGAVSAYIHRDPHLSPAAASALEQIVVATYAELKTDEAEDAEDNTGDDRE